MRGAQHEDPTRPRPEESPIAWFAELLLAIDRGNFEQAAESQRQLRRLGWRVDRFGPRRAHDRAEGGRW
jgi:hypothetical protein